LVLREADKLPTGGRQRAEMLTSRPQGDVLTSGGEAGAC